jgi:hypothetical protein
MPTGPNGQKRPADTNAAAVMVARIATGESEDDIMHPAKISKGVAGARARTDALSDVRRSEIARAAAVARWGNERNLTMAKMTERQILSDRFSAMKAGGVLVDMKFHLGDVSEATTEAVFSEVNHVLDHLRDGKVNWLESWGDSHRQTQQ